MKRVKKFSLITVFVMLFSIFTNYVYAASAIVGFSSDSTVAVGDNITVTMYVSNVTDTIGGVVSVGGNLSFDSEYLEYVSGTGTTTPYLFQINTSANYKIAGLDTTLTSGISTKTTVFTFVFKAKKAGTTSVTLTNAKLSDTSSKITSTVNAKTITIIDGSVKSNDSTLKSLGVTGYTLSPSFSSGTTSYTITVPSDTSSVTVTGAANDGNATVTGLGNITLTGATTTATIKVTAEDGVTTKTYTVKINKELPIQSSDATLKNLEVTGYTLSPSFSSGTTSYTVKVPAGTNNVTITGAVNDSKATVTGLGNITLTSDTTTAAIKVTAEDGTIKTYTVKINKETSLSPTKSNDATLKKLEVDGYILTPLFNKNTTSYEITVPNDTTFVTITGAVNDSKATVTGLGNITLTSNTTIANVKVIAEDGTIKTYTVKINKEAIIEVKDNDATLKSLDVGGYTLLPDFDKDIKVYSMTVANNITGLKVDAIPNSEKAIVSITGNTGWKEGINSIVVKVTAEDGTINAYVVNVTRKSSSTDIPVNKLSSDNYLSDLIINSTHEMTSNFNKNTSNYNITVPNEVTSLDLKTVLSDSKASVIVTGNSNFEVEKTNVVELKVTAEDGSVRIYTLNITRSNAKSANDLDNIIIGGATLKPQFSPDILDYTTTVDPDADKLDITVTPSDPTSKVEIIGNSNLKEGTNTVLIKVTDKNGFSKYYKIEVEKEIKSDTILGLTPLEFGIIASIITILLVSLLGILLTLLFRIKNRKSENQSVAPVIEVKPEFNFGSKNSSDDDVVHGNFNQSSEIEEKRQYTEQQPNVSLKDAEYREIPYDPYDDIVTKEEIINAIKEKDTSKLKMLLEQEELNRKKELLKEKEEKDEWR